MHIPWIYTGDDGKSHFADLEVPMEPVNFGIAHPAIDGGRDFEPGRQTVQIGLPDDLDVSAWVVK